MPDRIRPFAPDDRPKKGEKPRQLPVLPKKGKGAQWRTGWREWPAIAATVAGIAGLPAHANNAALSPSALEAMVRDFMQTRTAGLTDEVRLEVLWPSEANRLPACTAAAPELPPGQRLWGRVTVTLRCLAPQPWEIYIPVTLRRFGPYVITARVLYHRSEVTPADLTLTDGELTALPEDVVREPATAIGQVVRVSVAAGQPLRASWLEAPLVIRNGDPVKVIHQGSGFHIETQGRAMNSATRGARVRVRLANGQVAEGEASNPGVVTLTP